jgi:glycosyltransferase involved in cell wall biosynthesis
MKMVGLMEKLRSVKPAIVYSLAAIGWIPLDAALFKSFLGYKLFTGSHTTASVFPLAQRETTSIDPERVRSFFTRFIPGRFTSLFTEKCYGATKDCADIAVRFFGIQKYKIEVCPLGVDTDMFSPVGDEEDRISRLKTREQLGFAPDDIVCIYTGRFAEDKNPLILARAIERLMEMGEPYKGFFVGHGIQSEALKTIQGCIVHPFVPVTRLPHFYRASDIGVWPTQESTSMLDAAACGLPLIVNDTRIAQERIEGNGIMYRLNDVDDMVRALLRLRDSTVRQALGAVGARRMVNEFSWAALAHRRMKDFEAALASR